MDVKTQSEGHMLNAIIPLLSEKEGELYFKEENIKKVDELVCSSFEKNKDDDEKLSTLAKELALFILYLQGEKHLKVSAVLIDLFAKQKDFFKDPKSIDDIIESVGDSEKRKFFEKKLTVLDSNKRPEGTIAAGPLARFNVKK